LSKSSIWHTHYQAELESLETGLSDLSLPEEVEWIICQSAPCTANQRDEKGYGEVVKRVARMHDRLAGWTESEGVTRSALSVARALCAWGLAVEDDRSYGAGTDLVRRLYERLGGPSKECREIGWWIEVLRLSSAAAAGQRTGDAHLLASRCVAVLMNDFFEVETERFLGETVPGIWDEKRGVYADCSTALEAADALSAEGVRCGDERLFDWSVRRALALVAEGELEAIEVEIARRIGMRAWFHRGDIWGIDWLERPWDGRAVGSVEKRLASLAVVLGSVDAAQV
jgi:hypothetical protein